MLFLLLLGYFLFSVALYFLFEKAGISGWKAIVPIFNLLTWCKLIGRPAGYALLLLIPIVNIFVLVGMTIDLARSFNRLQYLDSLLSVLFMPVYFLFIGLSKKVTYAGAIIPREKEIENRLQAAHQKKNKKLYKKILRNNPYRKSWGREWVESLTFGIFAAAFIRMFLIEAYAIPTSSMEGSLLVGDRIFVSKAHYGLRLPMTIAMTPLVHNRLPFFGMRSYLDKPQFPYRRLAGFEKVEVGDQIVFNWPVGDSIFVTPERNWSAYQVRNNHHLKKYVEGANFETHPIDKRDHYVKRCMATPGDRFEIINGVVFVNEAKIEEADGLQFKYLLSSSGSINQKMLERFGVNLSDSKFPPNSYHLSKHQIDAIRKIAPEVKIDRIRDLKADLFPHDPNISGSWTVDNYGPIQIPAKGQTVDLTLDNISLYRRIIDIYEGHDFAIKQGVILIDGKPSQQYTFAQDYYWGMGDNRHNSEDSRSWGFIPEDHIVGKPMFILFSTKNANLREGFHWNRTLSPANRYN